MSSCEPVPALGTGTRALVGGVFSAIVQPCQLLPGSCGVAKRLTLALVWLQPSPYHVWVCSWCLRTGLVSSAPTAVNDCGLTGLAVAPVDALQVSGFRCCTACRLHADGLCDMSFMQHMPVKHGMCHIYVPLKVCFIVD